MAAPAGTVPGKPSRRGVADLDALRQHWGYDRWVVGGHSWGAALALSYALAHPARTRAVIYISGPGVTPSPSRPAACSRAERLTPDERAECAQLEQRARAGEGAAATRLAHLYWRTDFSDPGKAPDFHVAPMFAFPRNVEAAEALRRSADERLHSGELVEEVRRFKCWDGQRARPLSLTWTLPLAAGRGGVRDDVEVADRSDG